MKNSSGPIQHLCGLSRLQFYESRQDPPDGGVNVLPGEFVLVAQKPFKIGDGQPSRIAQFTKKIGGVTDQPPFGIV